MPPGEVYIGEDRCPLHSLLVDVHAGMLVHGALLGHGSTSQLVERRQNRAASSCKLHVRASGWTRATFVLSRLIGL
jgi:hypothetical protein